MEKKQFKINIFAAPSKNTECFFIRKRIILLLSLQIIPSAFIGLVLLSSLICFSILGQSATQFCLVRKQGEAGNINERRPVPGTGTCDRAHLITQERRIGSNIDASAKDVYRSRSVWWPGPDLRARCPTLISTICHKVERRVNI